jgi:protein gp37
MGDTAIEWTDKTWNPVTGCDKVSPGCDHCYAESIAHRFAGTKAFPNGFAVTLHPDRLDQPLRWRKPAKVFVNSMSDLFHKDIPNEYVAAVFATMACAQRHTFQVLTKRPGVVRSLLTADAVSQKRYTVPCSFHDLVLDSVGERFNPEWAEHWQSDVWPLPNVWLGTSIESDKYCWRADVLRETPAAVRFLSLEPLLGPLPSLDLTGIDWVIVGGESGPRAREMYPNWVYDIRDRCNAASVPFLFKQWGGRTPKANGRVLDGRTWDEYPGEA